MPVIKSGRRRRRVGAGRAWSGLGGGFCEEVLRIADRAGMWARSGGSYMVPAMSEEQLKAAAAEATAQVDDGIEEISEEDLEGVTGGIGLNSDQVNPETQPKALCTCGEDNCDCMSCDTESTAD